MPSNPVAAPGSILAALRRDPKALRALVACTLAMLATTLEPAFFTLSTPAIQSRLRQPDSSAPLIVGLGFLTLAVLTLVAGTSGDLFGRKRILVAGLTGLVVSNLLAMVALGVPLFVLADVLSTAFAVLIIPMAVAIVTQVFAPPLRPFAYGILFGFQGAGLVIGASAGGLCELLGIPRAAFIPVIVVGIAGLWLVLRDAPESRAPATIRRASAYANMLLLAAVFVAIYGVVALRELFTSLIPLLVAGGLLVLLLIFTWWLVRRIPYFHADELYTQREVAFAILAGVILSFAQGAFFYQISTFFQKVQSMHPALAGIAVSPYVAGLLVASLLVARLILRFGVRRMIAGGLVLMSIGLVAMSFIQASTPYWLLVFPITLMGFGFGVAVPARTQIVLAAPPVALVGSAAAVNAASSQSGSALGIVVSSALVTRLADAIFLRTLSANGVPGAGGEQIEAAAADLAQRLLGGGYPIPPPFVLDLAQAGYDKAFTTGLGQMFLVLAAITVLTAAVSYFGIRDEKKPPTTALTTAGRTGKPV